MGILDTGWLATIQGSVDNLNAVALLNGSSLPATNCGVGCKFLLSTDGLIYENTGTYATPVWTARTNAGGQQDDEVIKLSTTIGDYSSPSSIASASSEYGTADYDLDFTEYADQTAFDAAWVPNDTAKIRGDPTNDRINFTIVGDTTNDSISFDLTASATTRRKVRFTLNYSTLTTGAHWGQHWIGFSDVDRASGSATNQDFAGLFVRPNSSTGSVDADGANLGATVDNSLANPSTGTTYYYEIEIQSTTAYIVRRYSSSAYSSVSESAAGTHSATSLRYFVIRNDNSGPGGAGTAVGIFDDFVYWNSTADYAIDNSTSTAWTSSSEANPYIAFDLGSARDIVAFAININKTTTTETQFKIRISTDTTFTDGETVRTINISDFTDDTWRFILINRTAADARYFQIYGTTASAVVFSINEVKVRYGLTDSQMLRTHWHKLLNKTSVHSGVDSN